MRNITMVFILTCLFFLTGCTTKVEPDERVLYIEEEITETAEEITETAEETEYFKIKEIHDCNIGYYSDDGLFLSCEIKCYRIYFVREDKERYEKLTNHSGVNILSEDYEILKNKKATTLTLDEIETLENNYDSYVKKLKEESNKEANRERTPEEIYSSY